MNGESNIVSDIEKGLKDFRKRQNGINLTSGSFLFGAIFFGIVSILLLLESIFKFDSSARTLLMGLSGVTATFIFSIVVIVPALRLIGVMSSLDDFEISRRIGSFFPTIKDRLFNLLELRNADSVRQGLYSAELLDSAFVDFYTEIQNVDFRGALEKRLLFRSHKGFLFASIASLLLFASFPSTLIESFTRLVNYDQEYIVPQRYTFVIYPGNVEIIKGEDVEISVAVRNTNTHGSSEIIGSPVLVMGNQQESAIERINLEKEIPFRFKKRLEKIRASFSYFIELDDTRSDTYKVTVVDRPVIRSLRVRLDFPKYSKLPSRIQEDFVGDVTALAGTKITIEGSSSKDISRGKLNWSNKNHTPLRINGDKFSASVILEKEISYSIYLEDHDNVSNINPITYNLKIFPDEYPSVVILYPGKNSEIAGDQLFPLTYSAKDDYGISQIRIAYRLLHSRYEPTSEKYSFVSTPLPQGESRNIEAGYNWNISSLNLVPEDVVEYYLEVFDNDVISGPKRSQSKTYLIRLPSMEEVFAELDKGHERSISELQRSVEEAKQLKEKISSLSDDMKKNKEIDWQQRKKAEDLTQRYKQLQKQLDEVKKNLDEMVSQMQTQNVLSSETLEKYLELQHLFEQLNAEEIQKALAQMQMAMQNLSRDQLQQALQQLTFSEERFRASIERTINLLKRIQIEQKLDELRKRAEELSMLQEQLRKDTEETKADQSDHSSLISQQEDLRRKEAELEERASNLEKSMEEFFTEMPVDQFSELNKELQKQEIQKKMTEAANLMRSGDLQRARGLQKLARQSLQQFAENLRSLQEELLRKHSEQTINELRRAIRNLLELSNRQESLKEQARIAPLNSPVLRQNAQDQMQLILDLQHVIAALGDLSQRSFAITPEIGKSMGEAFSKMHSALRSLEVRSGQMAANDQQEAMGSLNKGAKQIQQSLNAMMQAGGGGMPSLLQQLQAMAGQQMSINLQTQSLGEGLGEQIMSEAARLATEQEAVRKSLEQLQREAQASGEQQRILGDLQRIAEEMKEIVRNLEQNNVGEETIQKQDRILSRLLDASRSMRERDFEKKRRAQTGNPITGRRPMELDPETLKGYNQQYEDILKALEQGYSKEYQDLIRKYFEEVRKIKGMGNRKE